MSVKKNIFKWLGIIVIVIFLATSAVVFAVSLNTKDIGITYEQAIKSNKPFVVMFHAPWCSYCNNFMPKYKQLSEIYENKYNFVMVNGDNPTNYNLAKDYAVGSFPTLYIVDSSINNRIMINQTLYSDMDLIQKELDRYLRIRSMIK